MKFLNLGLFLSLSSFAVAEDCIKGEETQGFQGLNFVLPLMGYTIEAQTRTLVGSFQTLTLSQSDAIDYEIGILIGTAASFGSNMSTYENFNSLCSLEVNFCEAEYQEAFTNYCDFQKNIIKVSDELIRPFVAQSEAILAATGPEKITAFRALQSFVQKKLLELSRALE